MSLFQSHSRQLLLLTALLIFPLSAMCEDNIPAPYSTTSTHDTLVTGDTIIVIHTICAPVCSSCARVYNKGWHLIGTLTPPFQSPFPEAYIKDGKLLWRDNYPQLLDEDELRYRNTKNVVSMETTRPASSKTAH